MNIIKTDIEGLLIIEPQVFNDNRGYFFESHNQAKLEQAGINLTFVQDNESSSLLGVVRGLHYQLAPYAQTKLVRAVLGRIYDVAVDLRRGSPTYGKHYRIELSDENKRQLLIPKGFAHGFSVLSERAILAYKCDAPYNRSAERGIAYNDPTLGIDWGVKQAIVSDKDLVFPTWDKAESNFTYGL